MNAGDKHTLLWMLLLATLIWCAWWHTRENRQLSEQWKKQFGGDSARWLTRFAWSRTIQLLAALTFCTAIIMVYDWQLTQADTTINDLNKTKLAAAPRTAPERKPIPGNIALTAQAPAQAVASYYPPQATQAQIAQIPQQAAPAGDEPSAAEEDNADINAEAPQLRIEAAQENAPEPLPAPAQANTPVEDVYNPEQVATDKPAKLDRIKTRYEDILVTYFYLSKCNKTDTHDYQSIIAALTRELMASSAPGEMRNDIVSAAQGSYQEVYAGSACDAATITPLYSQYSDYISSITSATPER